MDLILEISPGSSSSSVSDLLRASLGLDIWELTPDHMIVRATEAKAERVHQLGYRVEQLQSVAEALSEFESAEQATLVNIASTETTKRPRDVLAEPARYHTVKSLNYELQELAATHPDLVELKELGHSVEGQPILALRIGERRGSLHKVLFLGCHHAREWISVEIPFLLAKDIIAEANEPSIYPCCHVGKSG